MRTQRPSFFSALSVILTTSLPDPGSLIANAPTFLPEMRSGRYLSFCALVPLRVSWFTQRLELEGEVSCADTQSGEDHALSAVGQRDRPRRARELYHRQLAPSDQVQETHLLHHDRVVQVALRKSSVLLRRREAQQPHLPKLLPQVHRECILLVGLLC